MDQVQFGPEVARSLATKIRQMRMSGAELASFGEQEPALAAECGVEIAALEARTILAGAAADRILASAEQAAQANRPFLVHEADMRALTRLEGVVTLADSRIMQRYMALEGAESNVSKIGAAINVVSGLAGLVRTFF
jgi:hypothetical protein